MNAHSTKSTITNDEKNGTTTSALASKPPTSQSQPSMSPMAPMSTIANASERESAEEIT